MRVWSTFTLVPLITAALLGATCARAQDTLADLVRWQATKDAPELPNTPAPVAASINVALTPTLRCVSAGGTQGYDFYLGTTATPAKVASAATCLYAPQGLLPSTKYYWKVVAKNPKGTMAGPVWSFTTAAPPPPPIPTVLSVVCPVNVSVAATLGTSTIVTFPPATATGGVPGGNPPYSIQASPASGSPFPLGVTPVHVVVTDALGSQAQCTFTVTVTGGTGDTPPPTLSCSTTHTVYALASPAPGVFAPPVTGGLAPVTVTCTPASGAMFAVGEPTNVSCTARDALGRSAGCVFPVSVQIVTPATLTLNCPSGLTVTAGGTPSFGIPQPTDAVGGVITFCDHAPTDAFPLGVTPVSCEAHDRNGSVGKCTFTVTVTAAQ